jgi:malonyl-CoA O-methyltransferase
MLSAAETPTLFLPGWGFDGRVLGLLRPAPDWIFPETPMDPATIEDDLLQLLTGKKAGKVRLVGWSMGAMLGLDFAAKHPELFSSLLLVSLRRCWPREEVQDIREDFNHDPEGFMKTFYRKCFLGSRETYRSFGTSLQPLYLADLEKNSEKLRRGLAFLETFQPPAALPAIPTRLVHGRQDIIVPVQEMAALPGAAREVIETAGHFLFLHPESFYQQEVKKKAIRVRFSRAAASYDSYAVIQKEVARKLALQIKPEIEKREVGTILEIGCGTGNFTELLATRFPAARITAIDFSPEMVERARAKLQNRDVRLLCVEGEKFLRDAPAESYDLVTSNGSLQWFADLDRALGNIARVLAPGGAMACSIFGPESLQELGQGLATLYAPAESLAAQSFLPRKGLTKALKGHFPGAILAEERLERKYQSLRDLLRHIQKTGTAGWPQAVPQRLTPSRVSRLDQWFTGTYGSCRVTYQIFFLQGKKGGEQ